MEIEQMKLFVYMKTVQRKGWKTEVSIKTRIGIAKTAFHGNNRLITGRLSIEVAKILIKYCKLSVW